MLRKSKRLLIAIAAFAQLAILLVPAVAHAATTPAPLNLTTSPLPINLVTKPGQTVTADLRIENTGTQTEQLRVDLMKFSANGQDGSPQLQSRGPSDTYFDWVTFSQPTFTAEPNVWKTIRMTIAVPKNAAFGYYYAAVFSRVNPARPTGGQTALQGGVATLVLLDVEAPGAKRSIEVAEFTANHKIYEFLPTQFTVRLHNNGNIHVAPVGSIFIKRGSKQVDIIGFNTAHGNILPGTNRVFTAQWQNGFPVYKTAMSGDKIVNDKHGNPVQKLTWDFNSPLSKLRFGHYTANLVAVYDNGQQDIPVEATVSFWVIPWRMLLVVIVVLALPVFLGYKYYQMRKKLKRLQPKADKK